MKVEIWSDVVCPWCFVGKRRFDEALLQFDHRDGLDVVWRSYELDPAGPREREGDYVGRLAGKYGVTRESAEAMVQRMVETGESVGIEFRFDRLRAGNTLDAHRLLHWAGSEGEGLQGALKDRLFVATFTEGRPVGDVETLASLAEDVGLDGDTARSVLASSAYEADVRADEREAVILQCRGVPFFVLDRRYALAGAQPVEVFLEVLEQAWDEAA